MSSQSDRPFAELPAALVEELLERATETGSALLESLRDYRANTDEIRSQLDSKRWLQHESELPNVHIPTTCGVDGSFAIERLLSTDLVAGAAVAMEGLTPPSEIRHWPEDLQYTTFMETEMHAADTGMIARALMVGMELELAANAPHGIVFFDGSLTTPLIYFNQGLNSVSSPSRLKVSDHLLQNTKSFLQYYLTILISERTDKAWVAVPKYTTRREIGDAFGWPNSHDDRAMMTSILRPGEYTKPTTLSNMSRRGKLQEWHLTTKPVPANDLVEVKQIVDEVAFALSNIQITYYRPHSHLPALRLEMSQAVTETPGRLANVLQAVKHQCGTGAIMEPYPLYMADRMVQSLSSAIPTFRQVTSQRLAENYEGDMNDIFLGLRAYRTESGR